MTLLLVGIFIGTNVGLLIGAACCASGEADRKGGLK